MKIKCDFCEREFAEEELKSIQMKTYKLRACKSCFRMAALCTMISGRYIVELQTFEALFPNAQKVTDEEDSTKIKLIFK